MQKGENSTWETSSGIFVTIVYRIVLYYSVMGERLLEGLVFLAWLLKLQFLGFGRAGHCWFAAGSRLSERFVHSASSVQQIPPKHLKPNTLPWMTSCDNCLCSYHFKGAVSVNETLLELVF